jgi:hypothetical protein
MNTVKVEILVDGKITEQVSHFIYLGNIILELEKDSDIRLNRCSKVNDNLK